MSYMYDKHNLLQYSPVERSSKISKIISCRFPAGDLGKLPLLFKAFNQVPVSILQDNTLETG